VRICLAGTHWLRAASGARTVNTATRPTPVGRAVLCAPLRQIGEAQIRQHRATTYHSIYRADNQLLVSQHGYGIPVLQSGFVI